MFVVDVCRFNVKYFLLNKPILSMQKKKTNFICVAKRSKKKKSLEINEPKKSSTE